MIDKEISGFINIDKPEHWSSHDVVAKMRKLLGLRRIGHAGTLDPFATGALPVAVGNSTRLMRFLPKSKKYLAEVDLSFTTDTDDYTGEKLQDRSTAVELDLIKAQLDAMLGNFDQVPPLYSAKKINGKKLYELMREGVELDLSEIKSKTVHIKEIKIIDFDYPRMSFEVSCGEGTYIRAIARDIGGHLTALRRLESNGFGLESAIRFEDLEDGDLELEDLILNPLDFLQLPKVDFDRKEVLYLQQGRHFYLEDAALAQLDQASLDLNSDELYITCLDDSKGLVGLASLSSDSRNNLQVQPKVIL